MAVNNPLCILEQAPKPSIQFVEWTSISSTAVVEKLIGHCRVIISGLPGVGKTEMAAQIVHKSKKSRMYKGIFWLSAADEKTLAAGINVMARKLVLSGDGNTDFETIRRRVLDELNMQDHWLLVLDNVDNVDLVADDFLPIQDGSRHVLITSRYQGAHTALNGIPIHMDVMNLEDAMALFSQTHSGSFTQDKHSVVELVRELGYLPLAIVQAGAYLTETQDYIPNYLKIYRESRKNIWNWKPEQRAKSYVSVATVMTLSFKKIKTRAESVRLLCLISFLAPDDLPNVLWKSDPRIKDDTIRTIFATPADFNEAIAPLCTYSFVWRTPAKISIHRMVQDVVRDILEGQVWDHGGILDVFEDSSKKTTKYWITRTVETLDVAYPDADVAENWQVCESINPHILVCMEHCTRNHVATNEMISLRLSIGVYESRHGSYTVAEMHFEEALLLCENAFGVDHINTANTINNLGSTYDSQGKYDEAIVQYQRALRIFENAFGVDHINTADTINNLGLTYHRQGKYNEAIVQYQRALRIYENAFGVDHINTADTINNLGLTYDSQGKDDEAIAQYQRALRIYENALGVDHIHTADTIMNIALLYKHQGNVNLAKEQSLRGYHIFKTNLGEFHPKTQKAILILRDYGGRE